jgi:hypothetical protein
MTCNAGFADCNANRGDGCEVEVANDINHCGRCANRCNFVSERRCSVRLGRLPPGELQLAGFENADGIDGERLRAPGRARRRNGGHLPFSGGTLRGLGEDPMPPGDRPERHGDARPRATSSGW